jgi:predicted enzyme related to lactoylglutathione lyase
MATNSDRGLFVWHELNTTEITSAADFYSRLIGWKTRDWDQNPAYKIWTMGREGRGGLYSIHEEPNVVTPPPHWLSYVGTPDVDATVRQTVELGGKVVTPAYDVPKIGRMAVLQDPQGGMFAISAQVERSRYREPQVGDFSWHELLTTNRETAFDFYSKLFGWEKITAMDMGGGNMYQIYGTGGHQLGGIYVPPTGLPGGPIWIAYVMVRDARKVAETAKGIGAQIVHGPIEVPGGDWVFTGIDRQGAFFATHSRARRATATTAPTTMETRRSTKARTRRSTKAGTRRSTKDRRSTKMRSSAKTRSSSKSTKRKQTKKRRRS